MGTTIKWNIDTRRWYYNAEGVTFRKVKHPLATSHWDVAMKAARMADLTQAVEAFLERRRPNAE